MPSSGLWIDLPFYLLTVDKSCSSPLAGRCLCLNGNYDPVRSRQRIDRKHLTGWQSIRIWEYCPPVCPDIAVKPFHGSWRYQRNLHTGKLNIRRHQVNAFCMMQNTFSGRIGWSIRILPIASDSVNGSLSGCGFPSWLSDLLCVGPRRSEALFFPLCQTYSQFAQVVVLPTPPSGWRWRWFACSNKPPPSTKISLFRK